MLGINRSDPITWCPGPPPWPSLLTLHGQSRPDLHATPYTQLGVFKNLGDSACTGPVLSASLGVGLRLQEFLKLFMWFHSAVPAQNSAPGSLQTLGRRAEGSLAQHCALGSSDWAAHLGAHLHPPSPNNTLCQGVWPTSTDGSTGKRTIFSNGIFITLWALCSDYVWAKVGAH